jgi:hypothetical protein
MAEIELERREQPFTAPEWVGREVTFDPAYRNSTLARARRRPRHSVPWSQRRPRTGGAHPIGSRKAPAQAPAATRSRPGTTRLA